MPPSWARLARQEPEQVGQKALPGPPETPPFSPRLVGAHLYSALLLWEG